ncbi:dTDP-glucose 4,6-dehydratase [Thermoplasma volcanium GSS1]|uniref:dTDP-glucose 4,6-dehydratase n=1 Tax=Thermoplasma volcanium (strain ATCC 51530 / DSM 4299 / JCM 9571 / NBRC 15438 / GSS1) TaxID=273116 RepID=Q97A88_THEVO|nr:dTDP-glucose 4,6-dehydratase [Thermoplasma volcanium]BAB60064.1 dTDP-glucose 4,6-dehydratase [Thermoplasma volcanium GSS1]
MKLLVTGGAGFIGSNFINYWLKKHQRDSIVNVDKLTYAANPDYVDHKSFSDRYELIKADIANAKQIESIIKDVDCVVNFAAESHVDNSIKSPEPFIRSNYVGVYNILEAVRKYDIRFHQISTDEVFGSLPLDSSQKFDEHSPYAPRNPYSATKAAADMLVRSYINTYGIKATISNCSNNYGPNQHREKLIPKTVYNAIHNFRIPIYGSGRQIRDWIHVLDHCSAIEAILERGRIGETYLVSARNEQHNIDVVKKILGILGKDESLIEYVSDRPGHDVRYAIDPKKIENELDWKPSIPFDEGLRDTVNHYASLFSNELR